ncbi:MAG: hypothetical protein KDK64_03335 [Chlamydiia bacterium]|nr:hypothetical protein [Chlamydiia bacterium]
MDLQLSNSQKSSTPYFEKYPLDLSSAIQKISTHFPDFLAAAVDRVGKKIQVAIAINCPQEKGTVAKKALQDRDILPLGLPVENGLVPLSALEKLGIVHSQLPYPAWWDGNTQTIYLSYDHGYGQSDIFDHEDLQTASLLFELHNAVKSSEMLALAALEIDDYVRSFEELEFQSTQETAKDIEALVEKGAFNPTLNEFKAVYPSFELHYLFQQVSGHSKEIARRYTEDNPFALSDPYVGSWKVPIDWTNKAHCQGAEMLKKILKGHLAAIYLGDELPLKQALKTLHQGYQSKEDWALIAHENLEYFRERYDAFIDEFPFENYVSLAYDQ